MRARSVTFLQSLLTKLLTALAGIATIALAFFAVGRAGEKKGKDKEKLAQHEANNEAAKEAVLKGTSSSLASVALIAELWLLAAKHQLHLWVERGASEANPADDPQYRTGPDTCYRSCNPGRADCSETRDQKDVSHKSQE